MSMAKALQRPLSLLLPLVLFAIIYHLTSSRALPASSRTTTSISSTHHPIQDCLPDLEYLYKLDLSRKIEYARQDIVVSYTAKPSRTEELHEYLPEFKTLELRGHSPEPLQTGCPSPLQLEFHPLPEVADLSTITFGVATTVERLSASINDFAHWIAGTNTRMVAYIEPSSQSGIDEVKEQAKSMGFELIVEQSDKAFTERYFGLTKLIYENRSERTRWGILIDDDTFFLSPTGLSSFLSTFDASKQHYIGGLTEDFGQIKNFGYHGYGGASIILSTPLLEEMHRLHDICSNEDAAGDVMISTCIYKHTTTKFTMEHRLHQLDMNGDLSGIYEGGSARPQPLSMHHWKSWHHTNVTDLAAVSRVCGDECLLQRWKYADGWWLTNGYSLVKYSADRPVDDIYMEKTWEESGDYRHSFDPLRPKDEKKISYKLEAVRVERSRVKQFYIRRTGDVDEVFEAVWWST